MAVNTKTKSSPSIAKIEREPMHDKVYSELKKALMEAKFEAGSQLSLRELAGMFGVSVAPVRAALLRLMAEKAVVQSSATNTNFYVPQLSRDEFEEIIRLRGILEGEAAELAATKISAPQVKKLNSLAERLFQAAEKNDPEKYLKTNRDFKFGVFEAAKSPVLLDLIESLWIRIGPLMHFYARNMKYHRDIDHYFDVVEALRNGDAEAARDHMTTDVLEGGTFLRGIADFSTDSE